MDKIQPKHLEKKAYVYLRQSTMRQVMENTGSTERQYALKEKPKSCGWPEERIKVLDTDLGLSGKGTSQREGFQKLLADLVKEEVGAIFVLEVSRLNRSSKDWHHLLHICQFTNTLIIDTDGCYDLNNFNDQLILGVKGVLSQAELEVMAMRLHGAKKHKARKGELRWTLPAGYCRDEAGRVVKDPDEEVRHCIETFFETYRGVSSVYDLVRYFRSRNLLFPRKITKGPNACQIEWVPLTAGRAKELLKNPIFAGAYVFGRNKFSKYMDDCGNICTRKRRLQPEEWEINLKDNHEGYITWDEYLQIREKMANNQPGYQERARRGRNSPIREGSALLQGIVFCKRCGAPMQTRYRCNGKKGSHGSYECSPLRNDGTYSLCTSAAAQGIDAAISKRILEILECDKLQVALIACDELDKEYNSQDHQWQLRIQRVQYEVDVAERRCKHIDPANKNVFDNLAREWEESLQRLKQHQEEYEKFKNEQLKKITLGERQKILTLSQDIPQLWTAPTTTHKERKQIIQFLIKDVFLERRSRDVVVYISWKGGAIETLVIPMKFMLKSEEKKHMMKITGLIRELVQKYNDGEIAAILRKKGLKNSRGREFTSRRISRIRQSYNIPSHSHLLKEAT